MPWNYHNAYFGSDLYPSSLTKPEPIGYKQGSISLSNVKTTAMNFTGSPENSSLNAYEEGTFTASLNWFRNSNNYYVPGDGASTSTTTTKTGHYTRIGKICHITIPTINPHEVYGDGSHIALYTISGLPYMAASSVGDQVLSMTSPRGAKFRFATNEKGNSTSGATATIGNSLYNVVGNNEIVLYMQATDSSYTGYIYWPVTNAEYCIIDAISGSYLIEE